MGVSYNKHDLLAFVVLSHYLDMHHLVFLLFLTFYWQLALTETPRTQDLAIFVMTTTTELITLPLCACARGKVFHDCALYVMVMYTCACKVL